MIIGKGRDIDLNNEMETLINTIAIEVLKIYDIKVPIIDIYKDVIRIGGNMFEDSSMDGCSACKVRKFDCNLRRVLQNLLSGENLRYLLL